MRIIHGHPPLFEEIAKVFPLARSPGIIFAWGDTVYVPSGGGISPELHAHESVHGEQQFAHPSGIEGWWRQYLEDATFRFDQELPAHAAEWRAFRKKNADPNERALFLFRVAQRLASPLYGNLVTVAEARRRIQEGR